MAPTLRLDVREEPGLPPLAPAVATAAAHWSELAQVTLVLVPSGEPAHASITWERGEHGPCPLFGVDTAVAHAGPVGPGSWIHLDAERDWDGPDGPSLARTLTHELGHLLGLEHSPDATSLMASDPVVDVPSPCDVDGLRTLYGGGRVGPRDLCIVRGDHLVAVLHGVLGEGAAWQVLDTDGDGDDELVLWRAADSAEPGAGDVVAVHFGVGPRPERTLGPLPLLAPGARVGLVETPARERLLVQESADGRRLARAFDADGALGGWVEAQVSPPRELPVEGDLDGDGRRERVLAARGSRWLGAADSRR